MTDDRELLRRYAEQGSEAAFTDFVQRHIDLVYATALRRTNGDAHRAADVAQLVFTSVARDARQLARHPVLSAWLHAATRNAALNLMISEQRRRTREAEAVARAAADAGPNWEQVRPLLDAAIDELSEPDRVVVVLRFLERLAFADIGAKLRISEDAARVRTDRALDKLRAVLTRHGITSSAAALGALVASQPIVAAPAGLAVGIVGPSLAAGAAASPLTVFFSAMTAKTLTIGAAGALLAFFIGLYVGSARTTAEPLPAAPAAAVSQADQQLAALRRDNDRLRLNAEALQTSVANLTEANAKLEARAAETPPRKSLAVSMSRGEVQEAVLNNLRQIVAARDQFHLENGRSPENLATLVGRKAYIKRMLIVDGEDYSGVSMDPSAPVTVQTPGGLSITYDPAGNSTTKIDFTPEEQAERAEQDRANTVMRAAQRAADAYRKAHNGDQPPNQQAIVPYFATAKEGADFVELMESRKKK